MKAPVHQQVIFPISAGCSELDRIVIENAFKFILPVACFFIAKLSCLCGIRIGHQGNFVLYGIGLKLVVSKAFVIIGCRSHLENVGAMHVEDQVPPAQRVRQHRW